MLAISHANILKLIFLILLFNVEIQAVFKMTKMLCTDMDDSAVVVETCRLKAVKRDVVEATVKWRLKKRIDHFLLHFELLRKYGTYKPWLLNGTMDVCKFFRDPDKSLLKILYKLLENYINVNHTCPYEDSIIVDRFRPHHENLLLPLPSADYLVIFGFQNKKNLIGNLKVWFRFDEIDTAKSTMLGHEILKL